MGIYRIPLFKDNFITEESISGNGGATPILNVAAKYVSISGGKFSSRIIGMFDFSSTSDVINSISAGYLPDPNVDSTLTAKLVMFNAEHNQQRAVNFNLNFHPLTSSWDEGRGYGFGEGNELTTTGFSNYMYRKASTTWNLSGGDYVVDSNSATQLFEESENLNLNITNIVKNWISGVSSNNGFILKLNDSEESKTGSTSASLDYFRKSFFGRSTNFLKWPRLQFEWDDTIKDYRNILSFGNSGYLYFYSILNNDFYDLSGTSNFPGKVFIQGITSNSSTSWINVDSTLSSLTAARIKKGIYRVKLDNIPFSLYPTYTSYRDNWTITSSISSVLSSSTGSLTLLNPFINSNSNINFSNITINILNFKNQYFKENIVDFKIFVKDISQSLQVLTASSTSYSNMIIENGFYRISTTKDDVDIDWQPLNFEKNGNWFTINMNNLIRNENYKIDFKLKIKNQELFFDGNNISTTFRVV